MVVRLAGVLLVILLALPTTAADWPMWRGPTADGRTPDVGFPVRWSPSENVLWKTPLPGGGHSSPIVSRGKVFVTGCVEASKQRVLYCLDRTTGRIDWEQVVLTAELENKHKLNSFASSTPAADGERVYVSFYDTPNARLFAYDYTGKQVWQKTLGEFHSKHGFCSPPMLYAGLVIVNCDHDGNGYVVALDRRTGAERWRIRRPNNTRSYCPPVVFEAAGRKQMVMTGSKCVTSYDPDTGAELWTVDGPTEQFVSSMVMENDHFFLTAGFPVYWVMAIRPDGTGNVTQSHVAWSKQNEGGYVPSPVAYGGYFFLVTDNGLASCWEAKSGNLKWKERLGRHHSGSAVAADGRIYFTDDDGITFVLAGKNTFDVLAKNPLGERCFSSPAFSDGQVFLRGEKHLYCFGHK